MKDLKKIKQVLALIGLIGLILGALVITNFAFDLLFGWGRSFGSKNSSNAFNIGFSLTNNIRAYENGQLKYAFGDTEVMTNIGKNFTAFKLSGNTAWLDAGSMLKNVTHVSWGDQGSLSASSVILLV